MNNMEKLELESVSVLVVEDDPGILNLLRTFFLSQGAKVAIEQNGKGVLQRVDEFCPDILILDVVMPYMDGFTILENLRESGNKTPAIMLTDKRTVDDKVKGLEFGADDYMTKPFSTKELLARVKNVLRRTRTFSSDQSVEEISVGSMQIMSLAREVRLPDGVKLQLTKTEFDLLHYLARKKLQVVSHGTLLKDVLGYKSDIETKALVMHIANMRKKIAKAALDNVKIETVAGVGYKLLDG